LGCFFHAHKKRGVWKIKTPAEFAGEGLNMVSLQTSLGQLSQFDIYCVHAFFATLGVERDSVTLSDAVNETAYVNEDFFAGAGINDKPVTFGFVEELYCSSVHW